MYLGALSISRYIIKLYFQISLTLPDGECDYPAMGIYKLERCVSAAII